jgi:hypothetical protein
MEDPAWHADMHPKNLLRNGTGVGLLAGGAE